MSFCSRPSKWPKSLSRPGYFVLISCSSLSGESLPFVAVCALALETEQINRIGSIKKDAHRHVVHGCVRGGFIGWAPKQRVTRYFENNGAGGLRLGPRRTAMRNLKTCRGKSRPGAPPVQETCA